MTDRQKRKKVLLLLLLLFLLLPLAIFMGFQAYDHIHAQEALAKIRETSIDLFDQVSKLLWNIADQVSISTSSLRAWTLSSFGSLSRETALKTKSNVDLRQGKDCLRRY